MAVKKIVKIRSLGIKPVYDVTTNHDTRNFVLENNVVAHNCNSTQPALRGFIEEFSSNCRFILTCNYKNRIIEPLHSRCACIEFKVPAKEKPDLAQEFLKRAMVMLTTEGVKFDKAVLVELIIKHFPDFRRVIGELQRYSVSGQIDTGILTKFSDINISTLIAAMKAKNYTDVRKWVTQNSDIDHSGIFRKLYDSMTEWVDKSTIPNLVLILAEYQYKIAFSADSEICLSACMADIMLNVSFK